MGAHTIALGRSPRPRKKDYADFHGISRLPAPVARQRPGAYVFSRTVYAAMT